MTSEVVPAAVQPQSLIFVRDQLQRFQASLISDAQQRLNQMTAQEAQYREGYEAAKAADEPEQMRRYRNRITRLQRSKINAEIILAALQEGYVPMPRLPAVKLDYVLGIIPAEVLKSLELAKDTGLFSEFRVVDGRDADVDGSPRGWSRRRDRDPILVGLIGDEMFPLAWWR